MSDEEARDLELVTGKLRALVGGTPEEVIALVYPGPPISKSRAKSNQRKRAMRKRVFATKASSDEEEALAARLYAQSGGRPISGCVAIVAMFFRPNYQRIDADNMMKLVMDAGTHARIWKDDCYVSAQAAFVEFDRDRPRTLIAFCASTSTMDRTAKATCEHCDGKFSRFGRATFSEARARYCSRRCYKAYRASTRTTAKCAKCEAEFWRQESGQKYCSRACWKSSDLRRTPRAQRRPWPHCQCGARVTRREYQRCSACAKRGRPRKAFAGGVHDPQGALGLPRAIIRVEECEVVKKAG